MKNLSSKLKYLKYTPKSIITTLLSLMVIVAAVTIPGQLFAWGPSRTAFYSNNPPSYVTFNSIVDNTSYQNSSGFAPTVDERTFMQIKEANTISSTYSNSVSIIPGRQYTIYMYYHNDTATNSGLNAYGSYALAQIPTTINNGENLAATGYIGASNANPQQVSDNVYFNNTSGSNITLRYMPGSATIHNYSGTNGQVLSDNIVTSGAPIGYNSLDGVIPGSTISYGSANSYAGYVLFTVQADQIQTTSFIVTKQVYNPPTNSWGKELSVNPGDNVNYQVTYTNNSGVQQNNVIISDLLASSLTYNPGSTTITSTYNQNAVTLSDGINSSNGVNIGSYAPGTTVYIKYSARVAANDNLPSCGANTISSAAQVQANGVSVQDTTANITVTRTCPTPAPVIPPTPTPVAAPAPVAPAPTVIYQTVTPAGKLPVTGPAEDITKFLGFGAIVTALGYYLASRRKTVKE